MLVVSSRPCADAELTPVSVPLCRTQRLQFLPLSVSGYLYGLSSHAQIAAVFEPAWETPSQWQAVRRSKILEFLVMTKSS